MIDWVELKYPNAPKPLEEVLLADEDGPLDGVYWYDPNRGLRGCWMHQDIFGNIEPLNDFPITIDGGLYFSKLKDRIPSLPKNAKGQLRQKWLSSTRQLEKLIGEEKMRRLYPFEQKQLHKVLDGK